MGQQHLQPNHEDQLVALGRALQILREEENADVLIETTLDYLQTEFNYRLIWIGLYDRLDHRLFGKGGITPTGDITFLKRRFDLSPGDLLEQVVIQQRPVGVPDLQQEPRAGEWRRAAQEFGIQGTLVFPLRCKDRCFGVALLGSHLWGVSPRAGEKAQLSLLLGGLAAALYQLEVEWQRSAIKRPDQPLFQVLDELMQVPTLGQRLEVVVTMTQEFVTPTRTNLYWYSPEKRYFWHRVGNRQSIRRYGDSRINAPGLTVAEANDFYQTLATGQLVAIGAARSLLKAETTERLLARLRTRSLLAAPIQVQGELLGFLSVEDNDARIWEEAEKNYIRAIAQVIGLVVESEEIEATLQQTQKDTHFAAEIAQAIAHNSDTTMALKECAELLCKRLDTERFLVLREDDQGQFTLVFQQQPLNRRPIPTLLPPLLPEDQPWLNQSSEGMSVEDLDKDLQLVPWRELLLSLGVRSLLLVPLKQSFLLDQASETDSLSKLSLLVVAQGTPRTWNHTQRDLVSIVAQQINLLLRLGQQQDSARVSLLVDQTLQGGLATLWSAPPDPVLFERAWLDYLVSVLECPLAALVSWTHESGLATVAAAVVGDPRFALPPDLAIPVAGNILIQDVLATSNFLCRSVTDLPTSIRKWLTSPGIGQLLVIALHTGTTPTTGILLLADHEERQWPMHLLPPLETLTQQFAGFRHYRHRLDKQIRENEDLQMLNWYKHRCLETLHLSLAQNLSVLLSLETKTPTAPTNTGEFNGSNLRDLGEINTQPSSGRGQPLHKMRRQQLLHQLEQMLAVLTPILKEEQWHLTVNLRPVLLAGLLKRSLLHVEPLFHQQQLMLKVHNPGQFSVFSDPFKLECMLFELLVTSAFHARPGSWINLWCSPIIPESTPTSGGNLSHSLLEVLISESGLLNTRLDDPTSSPRKSPPTLNLRICQHVVRSWGGDLQFYQLEGDRYSFRLLLPLVN